MRYGTVRFGKFWFGLTCFSFGFVLFGSIYKKSPQGNPYIFGLDSQEAETLQKIAWQVTQNFYKGK